jgi:hypothetical protein
MSLCDNAKEYAEKTYITLEQAKIRCQYFIKLKAKIYEAKKCPKCGEHTLEIESGSYEEGYSSYVYCENDKIPTVDEDGDEYMEECDFTSDVTKEFEPISHWFDFDVVLMFSINIESDGIKAVEEQIGCSWSEFVEKDTNDLLNQISA